MLISIIKWIIFIIWLICVAIVINELVKRINSIRKDKNND